MPCSGHWLKLLRSGATGDSVRKVRQSYCAPTSNRLARMFSTSLKSLRSCLFLLLVPSISSSAWKRKYWDSSLNSLFSRTVSHRHTVHSQMAVARQHLPTGSHRLEASPGQMWLGTESVLLKQNCVPKCELHMKGKLSDSLKT